MRIAFVGSRNWSDRDKIKKAIEKKKAIAEKMGKILLLFRVEQLEQMLYQ
jgi:hypothetical protein